ncbi:glutamate receptor 2-like [Copidosoma floridanum]|uniref:glutamate receptor 2-like n=1 Tax=Copidosoma floridanum TaxID=29053 RepID=UPI0006C9C3DC|nr:glutamate receptor 2-like [Copidosoma floridanum]
MNRVEMTGLTGTIKFDNQGFRTDFVLDIIEMNTKDGLQKIGSWNSTKGINFTRSYGEVYTQIVDSLHNKTFVVTTILVESTERRMLLSIYLRGNPRVMASIMMKEALEASPCRLEMNQNLVSTSEWSVLDDPWGNHHYRIKISTNVKPDYVPKTDYRYNLKKQD